VDFRDLQEAGGLWGCVEFERVESSGKAVESPPERQAALGVLTPVEGLS
jgi:hypothetical protein